ncbi:MAG TPA: ASPIC/UnbV domain-containing protein, partial [Vicinamibacterales bacterium]|nr:ASPIC/UnbV domain-containing protein [Vicinamibacterales bacterium]
HLRFEDVSPKAGAVFALSEVGRGAAFGDIDNDGDTDVVVNNNNGPARLLINNVGNKKHWLGVSVIARPFQGRGGEPKRLALRTPSTNARIEVIRKNSPTLWRRARTDGSYASANDARVLVGLGDSSETPVVRVHWPGGRTTDVKDVAIDRYLTVEEPAR